MFDTKSSLPQHDINSKNRLKKLKLARNQFRYNYNLIPTLAVSDGVPPGEYPKIKWIWLLFRVAIRLLRNSLAVSEKTVWSVRRLFVPIIFRFRMAWRLTVLLFFRNQSNFFIYAGRYVQRYMKPGKALTLEDYNGLFLKIGIPKLNRDFDTDENFARMRVAGWNPTVIEGIQKLPPNFPVSNKLFTSIPEFQGDSLTLAASESRLYLVNYEILSLLKNGDQPRQQKYAYAPMALFALTRGKRFLRPVAIQCNQNPSESPIFTPLSDEWAWKMAKTVVNSADANFHELVAHLARTHLFIEPIIIATYRQLSERHPIFRLLVPHFYGTIFINNFAKKKLIASGGGVEHLLSGSIESIHITVLKAVKNWGFNESMFPVDLERRKVKSSELLPYYPYRDDGLLIWNSIYSWVKSYLRIYYSSNRALKEDGELALWTKEIVSFAGGRVKNFGENEVGEIHSLAYLAKALTHIIFTSTASHSAINSPQRDVMIYAPQVPIGLYGKAPEKNQIYTEKDWLAMLPPLEMASLQVNLGFTLGAVIYKKLGDYGFFWSWNMQVRRNLKQFKENLKKAEKSIEQRNHGKFPYKALLPSRISNSINI